MYNRKRCPLFVLEVYVCLVFTEFTIFSHEQLSVMSDFSRKASCVLNLYLRFYCNFPDHIYALYIPPFPWSLVTQIFRNGYLSHCSDRNIFEVMSSNQPLGTLGSVESMFSSNSLSRKSRWKPQTVETTTATYIREYHCNSDPIVVITCAQSQLLIFWANTIIFNSTLLQTLLLQEEFEDTTGVIRIRTSKDRHHNGQKTEGQTPQWPKDRRTDNTMAKRKRTNGQTTI